MTTIPFIYNNPNCSDAEGVFLALTVNRNGNDKSRRNVYGFRLAGLANTSSDFFGVQIAALVNEGDNLTGASIGALNWYDRNKGFALQIGLANILNEYNENGTVIQFGLYNRVGNRTSPFFNIKRKKKTLEDKT